MRRQTLIYTEVIIDKHLLVDVWKKIITIRKQKVTDEKQYLCKIYRLTVILKISYNSLQNAFHNAIYMYTMWQFDFFTKELDNTKTSLKTAVLIWFSETLD